jgi:hypothetical protein
VALFHSTVFADINRSSAVNEKNQVASMGLIPAAQFTDV